MNSVKVLLFILCFHSIESYFDVSITDARVMIKDAKYIKMDYAKVKRLNRTEYVLVASFETLMDLTDDYQVIFKCFILLSV